jgi:uncharacterized spore protein YtfJ
MTTVAGEIIGKLMEELRTVAKTETILGQEIKVGEYSLIPVSRISLGLGAGGGKGSEDKKAGEGGGGGGGVVVTPIAFIVSKGEDISFHAIKQGGLLDGFFAKLPEVAEKIMAKVAKVQEAEAKSAEPEAG